MVAHMGSVLYADGGNHPEAVIPRRIHGFIIQNQGRSGFKLPLLINFGSPEMVIIVDGDNIYNSSVADRGNSSVAMLILCLFNFSFGIVEAIYYCLHSIICYLIHVLIQGMV